jgi:hypothetical protein
MQVRMANRVYLISSLCFLTGAGMALRLSASPVNLLYLLGSFFFVIAASIGVFGRKRR